MAALRPVGVNTTFATSATSAKSVALAQQSDSIRVVVLVKVFTLQLERNQR